MPAERAHHLALSVPTLCSADPCWSRPPPGTKTPPHGALDLGTKQTGLMLRQARGHPDNSFLTRLYAHLGRVRNADGDGEAEAASHPLMEGDCLSDRWLGRSAPTWATLRSGTMLPSSAPPAVELALAMLWFWATGDAGTQQLWVKVAEQRPWRTGSARLVR